jgi:hypothetical protein
MNFLLPPNFASSEATANSVWNKCMNYYLLTSWESYPFAASQKIPRILWHPNVHYRTHKCLPPVSILSQLDPVDTPLPTTWRSILTLSLLMSCIYGAACKARNFKRRIYMDLRLATLKAVSFYLLHNVSTLNQCRKFSASQLCVNALPATKIALITNRI